MRILHTSDWHLGRSFHGAGLLDYQAAYVDHLLEVVAGESVDLVVVCGDVYDRALPQVDAVDLADETFARLAASRARVVVSSGNHDSARRLGFGSRLIDAAGIFIRTDLGSVGEPVLLEDAHGQVAVHALPYLDPVSTQHAWGLSGRSHEAALSAAMRRVRADLTTRSARSVVLAHAFVAGAEASDSERDISVGGISIVSTSVFAGIDYTALGHLHGRATLTDSVRYSGSPLAYSFSEAGHTKGSWLVHLGASGLASTTFVPAPVPRALARLTGTLEMLLGDPRHTGHEDSWVQATLTDAVRPREPMERLRARFPHVVALEFAPSGGGPERTPTSRPRGRTDHEIALEFVDTMRGAPAASAESDLLRAATDACCDDTDLDPAVRAVS